MMKIIIEILLIILVVLGIRKTHESIKAYGVVESVKRFFQVVETCVKWVAAYLYKLPYVGGLFIGIGDMIGWAWRLVKKMLSYMLNIFATLLKRVVSWAVTEKTVE
jgi:hypothetical protein